jgi:sortase A
MWIARALIVGGLATLAWSLAVYLWEDPFTSAYTAYRQRTLASDFEDRMRAWQRAHPSAGQKGKSDLPDQEAEDAATPEGDVAVLRRLPLGSLRGLASRYRAETRPGDAFARLSIPRLGLAITAINGTQPQHLRAGPGRHLATTMPGEGRLVYIAGHRTTYGAPFSRIDELRPGDDVRLELPYATIVYRVTGHTIVDDQDTSVLAAGSRERLALQACHPRFFATHRYIAWARPLAAFEPTRLLAS